jgi:hypothetical protein
MIAAAQPMSRLTLGVSTTARPSALEVFTLRCWARGYLWKCGALGLHDAVDLLWHAAERDGLVDTLGQDNVQRIIATEFEAVQ